MNKTRVVISRPQSILEQLSNADNVVYATYHQLAESGVVLAVDDDWDRPRQIADITLFTNYHREVRFGALSTDGTGLPHYGDFSMELREDFIAHRTSVLEENAVKFLDKRAGNLLDPKTRVPRGFRAPWATRSQVGIAKLADQLKADTSTDDIAKLILIPGPDSARDEFIEAHVFGPITRRTIGRVAFTGIRSKGRSTREKYVILKGLQKRLENVGIDVQGF
ncbi:MAG: hypothetical protein AAB353_05205 [Candidatus Hydrogenedentota bacterium]